jgi:hypothetical protein
MAIIKAPTCVVAGCGKPQSWKYKDNNGAPVYRNFCSKHHKVRTKLKGHKKEYCENKDGSILGFPCTANIIDPCQLHIDHSDGDRYNNDPGNLVTLCANCHALKTKREKNHATKYDKIATTTFDDLMESEENTTFNNLFQTGDNNGK